MMLILQHLALKLKWSFRLNSMLKPFIVAFNFLWNDEVYFFSFWIFFRFEAQVLDHSGFLNAKYLPSSCIKRLCLNGSNFIQINFTRFCQNLSDDLNENVLFHLSNFSIFSFLANFSRTWNTSSYKWIG